MIPLLQLLCSLPSHPHACLVSCTVMNTTCLLACLCSYSFLLSCPKPQTLDPAVEGFTNASFFQGMGSNHLVVSRLMQCSPDNVGVEDAIGEPFPCALSKSTCPRTWTSALSGLEHACRNKEMQRGDTCIIRNCIRFCAHHLVGDIHDESVVLCRNG